MPLSFCLESGITASVRQTLYHVVCAVHTAYADALALSQLYAL